MPNAKIEPATLQCLRAVTVVGGRPRATVDDLPCRCDLSVADLIGTRGGVRWVRGASSRYVVDLRRCSGTGYALGMHFCKGSDGMWRYGG